MKHRKRPRRLDYTVDIPFAVGIHRLPAHQLPSLLAWLRRRGHRRRPPRTFYHLDPATGTWERL